VKVEQIKQARRANVIEKSIAMNFEQRLDPFRRMRNRVSRITDIHVSFEIGRFFFPPFLFFPFFLFPSNERIESESRSRNINEEQIGAAKSWRNAVKLSRALVHVVVVECNGGFMMYDVRCRACNITKRAPIARYPFFAGSAKRRTKH